MSAAKGTGTVTRQTKLLTTSEAAELLGISTHGVHKLVARGKLRAMWHGNVYAFDPVDVERAKGRPRPGRPAAKKGK